MGKVATVLGDMDASELGHCQPHEHVYIVETPALIRDETLRINNLPLSINELKLYKSAGGDTIVDAQPLATGRDAAALQEASRISGVNIIACTGYHIPIFYDNNHWIYSTDSRKLTELFASEALEGMFIGGCYSFPKYRTDIRAGAVKTMITGEGPVGKTGELLRAAGNAAVIAGIPLLMHTESGAGSLEALDILSKVGLNPERVIICHADRKKVDIRLNREIAKTGAYLSYDTVSLFDWTSTDAEIGLILDMIEAGFEEKLMVSTDTTIDRMKSYGGNVGLDYIPLEFLPKLENAGVAKDIILKLVRINPSKALMRV